MILALETATLATSVALLRGEELVAEWTHVDARPHSERLLPAIDALLCGAGIAIGDVDAFAVSAGPGSFTGLRIGIATVKGLAFGSERPVAAVSTLAALALCGADGAAPVAALLDARRGEVYAALFAADGGRLAPDAVVTPEALGARLPPGTRIVVGEGAQAAADAVAARLGEKVRVLDAPAGLARAHPVGVLGARLLARGEGVPAAQVAPRYVRRAEAEVRRTGARFES
ncbi:MAG TPA: tRNA (adenosine(37)-N6)-threonylcarbamoyltransferase complex dimerization subunit type 1 TsaB [Myxococcota bacterium]|nr:tRNA (adenosine(37)-N6)-threonylcarbamoyltransferase complex dimerization subunit type 1 TsaB [Myxococcota bacterium]